MAEHGRLAVEWDGERVMVAVPDGPGVLSKTAGVLALHSLDVRSARLSTLGSAVVDAFYVTGADRGTVPGGSRPEVARQLLAAAGHGASGAVA